MARVLAGCAGARASLRTSSVGPPSWQYDRGVALDERAFFSERPENRSTRVACPRCRRTNDYTIRWVRRVKKDRLPPGADEGDRAKFAKVRDHLIRVDDEVVCKSCGKKVEIPSLHSLLFVDQLEGLPRDVEEDEIAAAEAGAGNRAEPAPPATRSPAAAATEPPADSRGTDRRGPRRVTSPPRGWRG